MSTTTTKPVDAATGIVALMVKGDLTTDALLDKLLGGKIDRETYAAAMAGYQDHLKASNQRALKCKVSEKGAVSVSGLNARFPTTLYADQWERLLDFGDSIRAFIKANREALASK